MRQTLQLECRWIAGYILFVLEVPGPFHHLNRFKFMRSQKLHEAWMFFFVFSRFLFFIHYFIGYFYRLAGAWYNQLDINPSVAYGQMCCAVLCLTVLAVNMTWVVKIIKIYIKLYGPGAKSSEEDKKVQ